MIDYNLDEDGILQVVFSDAVTYKDIIDWLSAFSEIQELPSKIHLIYDLRSASQELEMVKLIQVAKRTEEATSKIEQVRTVFLVEESKLDSYSNLFSILNTKRKTTRKIFSDEEEAIDWLLVED